MNATKLALASLMLTCLMPFANAQDNTAAPKSGATGTAGVETGDLTLLAPTPTLDVYLKRIEGGVKIETRRADGRPSDGFIVVCIEAGKMLWPVAVLKAQDRAGTTFKVAHQALEDLPLVLMAVEYRDDGSLEFGVARRMGELLAKLK